MSFSEQPESPLREASIALNEMFTTMVQSGFTELQALRLVAFLIEDMSLSENTD
jgi:hypothetical protein|tara:strand:+ start:5210 stop:5371 length:162 start_codon:yes stop_codon:yes gene_type:complete